MINPDRLIEIFDQAKARPAGAEREHFLDEKRQNEPELIEQVVSLLQSHEGSGDFLKQTMLISPPALITEKPGDSIGRYKLLEKVGEGGCGVVYVAEQTVPVRRRVALKVIKLGMDTQQVVARFEAERQALAMMDHPNIAKVLDAGATDTGRPYFVMELVRGIRITDYCDQNNLSTKERLDLFIKVCQAIQHAHQKGIIHRDIKPSNILVTLHDGVPVPKVIDFGIAKATEGRLTDNTVYTQLHQFIGTPAYMSPEQAEMSGLDIDTRSDIYSLGVLLYELLAGSTPFDAQELMASGIDAMRKTIREQEPVRPSTRLSQTLVADDVRRLKSPSSDTHVTEKQVGALPRRLLQIKETITLLRGDLDWIVMKCLEKDRTRRYETANGLAADLNRHLNNEPVIARPPSQAYRLQKLVRRNKLAFSAVAGITLVLVLGIIASAWQAARATRAERQQRAEAQRATAAATRALEAERVAEQRSVVAEAQRQRADQEALKARRLHYDSDTVRAFEMHLSGNPARAGKMLATHRPTLASNSNAQPAYLSTDLRGWEWRYLWGQTRPVELGKIPTPGSRPRGLAFDPVGRLLASVGSDNVVRLSELPSGREYRSTQLSNNVYGIAFSPDGAYLATSGSGSSTVPNVTDGLLAVWTSDTLRQVAQLATNDAGMSVAFAPNGKFLAGCVGHELKLWETGAWREIAQWDTTVGLDSALWKSTDKPPVIAVVVSSDNRTIAVSTIDGRIQLFDAETKIQMAAWQAYLSHDQQGDLSVLTALAFSPDGHTLVSAALHNSLRQTEQGKVWDIATRQLRKTFSATIFTFGAPMVTVSDHLAYSPDGSTLAVAESDGGVALWDTSTWTLRQTLRGHEGEVRCVAFSRDGRYLASGGADEIIWLWNTSAPLAESPFHELPAGGFDAGRSLDLDHFGIAFTNGTVTTWELPSLRQTSSSQALSELQKIDGFITGQLSSDGSRIALGHTDGTVAIFDFRTDRILTTWAAYGAFGMPIAFSRDDSLLLTWGGERDDLEKGTGKIKLWELHPLRERWVKEIPRHGDQPSVYFSANNQRIFLASREVIIILNGNTGEEIQRFDVKKLPLGGSWSHSRDDRTLVFAHGTEVKVWDLKQPTQEPIILSLPDASLIRDVALSPDSARLAVLISDGTIRLFDLTSYHEVAILKTGKPNEPFLWIEFIDNGDTVALVTLGGVYLWRAPTWPEIERAEKPTGLKQLNSAKAP